MTKQAEKIYLFILLSFILIIWGYFLNFGDIPFDYHDWAEVNAPRLAFLKDAVTKGRLPLHMPDSSALRGVTDRFMSLPDVILSPQIILLRWMSVGRFILIHTWILIIAGYFGLLKLKERFGLSNFLFTLLSILYFFNGHITSHYSVGHITWGGCFLLSWFIEYTFELLGGNTGNAWQAKTSFLLFMIFLQGSFHQFVWCVIFLGILAFCRRRFFCPILKTGIAAVCLSMVRIIPPALQMSSFDDDFLGGYTNIRQIFRSFLKVLSPEDALISSKTGSNLGWWEFDIFIGYTAAIIIFIGFIFFIADIRNNSRFYLLLIPSSVLAVFSIGSNYLVLRSTHIPLFSGERVSSRFMLLPFLFILVFASIGVQRIIYRKCCGVMLNIALYLLLIPVGIELYTHLDNWKVINASKAFPYTYTDLSIKTIANHPDNNYFSVLLIGGIISIISAFIIIIRARREKNATMVHPAN